MRDSEQFANEHRSQVASAAGASSEPRLSMCCNAGKIFLYARSPVAPKNTSASECSDSETATTLPARRPFDDTLDIAQYHHRTWQLGEAES